MNKRQIGLIIIISNFITLAAIAGSLLIFTQVSAAPPVTTDASKGAQTGPGRFQYIGLSSLALRRSARWRFIIRTSTSNC